MQENHLFEYAVIRIVPRVEREEFLNVGVIVYCKKFTFLQTQFIINEERLQTIFPTINLEEVRKHLHSFKEISCGSIGAGPIAALDMASRFRWLTAKRSTILQTSAVHPGLCKDPANTLNHLFKQQVLS